MCAWRALNEKDIGDIKASRGLSRTGGARGLEAMTALIGYNNQNTIYMAATESFAVIVEWGGVNNYVQFDTEAPGVVYISMNDLLTLDNCKKVREDLKADRKLHFIEDQKHGLIVKELPRKAMT